jgi:hypothetical protein
MLELLDTLTDIIEKDDLNMTRVNSLVKITEKDYKKTMINNNGMSIELYLLTKDVVITHLVGDIVVIPGLLNKKTPVWVRNSVPLVLYKRESKAGDAPLKLKIL